MKEEKRGETTRRVIALAGNPNVGKSTVFNALTGLNQHTGNWPGKTVDNASGEYRYHGGVYTLVDLPGTYSLLSHSKEEEIARDFLCFGEADAAVVVCDATCLERNLILALQITEVIERVVICINLMDEARKKQITVDLSELERRLGVPVVATSARSGKGLEELKRKVEQVCERSPQPAEIPYRQAVEGALEVLAPVVRECAQGRVRERWLSLALLMDQKELLKGVESKLGPDWQQDPKLQAALCDANELLRRGGFSSASMEEAVTACTVLAAEDICGYAVHMDPERAQRRDRRLDRLLTSRLTGIPIMLLLLCGVFWLTIEGANVPSALLSKGLFYLQDRLSELFLWLGAPDWLHGLLVMGLYRVLAWVISVMLPPMAIFFPLFTLLEDFGYLPRVAFNLDHCFQKAHACGKQALTMCMGLGCNAVGVVGCRIIDSPRERLIALLTNCFMPCNGRFPTLIAVLTMFFASSAGWRGSLLSTVLLTGVIVLGVGLTFLTSRLLSATLLKGEPSSFVLELPPYRRPQFGKVIVRSLLDRTLFVLGRAAAVAAPAGMLIWTLANLTVGGQSLLSHCAAFLDPFAQLLGLDGVILFAFLLGAPANEIVVPIILMTYLAQGSLVSYENLASLKMLLVDNGWTWSTAVSFLLFSLAHWPCSTTCLTIYRETKSMKWTLFSVLLPTAVGMTLCLLFHGSIQLMGLI